MFKLFSNEKPSQTAATTALVRAVAHKEFRNQKWGPDFIAECFLSFPTKFFIQSSIIRALGKAKGNKNSPGSYEYLIARTIFFDELFSQALKESIPQVVILGAGYDSRGLRFEHLIDTTKIIELDTTATQSRKIKFLKKNKIRIPDFLRFSTIDFNNQSLENALTSAGYQKEQRTLFVWEGVSMYLEAQAVKDTLIFIKQCSPSDSLLVFDYVLYISKKDIHKYHGAEEMLVKMEKVYKNEPFKFLIKEKNITSFLSECGHRMIRHLNQDQIERNYLKKEDGSSVGKPNGIFNMVITSPEP